MRVGITERGDAGLDFSWVNRLERANVIITKHLSFDNSELLTHLVNNKDKIILHATCTGWGGSLMEPSVPKPTSVRKGIDVLKSCDFPIDHVVLRLDPIIPTVEGAQKARDVLELFKDSGIERVRYSFVQMYPHAVARFRKADVPVPYNHFRAYPADKKEIKKLFSEYDIYRYESCAEHDSNNVGCISIEDFMILSLPYETEDKAYKQRAECNCYGGKTELLSSKQQCKSGCLYCYWKG